MHQLVNTMTTSLKKGALLGSGLFFALLLAALLAVPSAHAAAAKPQAPLSGSGAIVYTHIATSSNSAGDWTDLDNTVTNNNPNALVFVTPNWAPYQVYDNDPIGV